MEELFEDRQYEMEEIPQEGEGSILKIQVFPEGEAPIEFELEDFVFTQNRPTEIGSDGTLLETGVHTLSISGIVRKSEIKT